MSDHKAKGVDLSLDVAKQFLSLALGGIAFAIGISVGRSGVLSSWAFWTVVAAFTLSCVSGLLYLMHGVSEYAEDKAFDVYATLPRVLAIVQVCLVGVGVIMLLFVHLFYNTSASKPDTPPLVIVNTASNSIHYPITTNTVTVSIDPSGSIRVGP